MKVLNTLSAIMAIGISLIFTIIGFFACAFMMLAIAYGFLFIAEIAQ